MTASRVRVEVATMWTSPDAPRNRDAAVVADIPDTSGWTASLSPTDRLDLHGRTLTQLLLGEPVTSLDDNASGWVKVAAAWQPAPESPSGYVGWVRSAHLETVGEASRPSPGPVVLSPATPSSLLHLARRHHSLPYLWGGTSPWGFDCSGLVHYCHRQTGTVVPRDASAQHAAATPVTLGVEEAGDLYFFASAGSVDHVAFVVEQGVVLHATETPQSRNRGAGLIEESRLNPARTAQLVSAGRFL